MAKDGDIHDARILLQDAIYSIPSDRRAEFIGQKAAGLCGIPRPWTPPFFVISTAASRQWRGSTPEDIIADRLCAEVRQIAQKWDKVWPNGIILRSSAVGESLRDRGSYLSVKLAADFNDAQIGDAFWRIFSDHQEKQPQGDIAIIAQPLVKCVDFGHMSNERRVSKTVNHWMWESHKYESATSRFNSQRETPASETTSLPAGTAKRFRATCQKLGAWLTALKRGPCHVELARSQEHLWVVQVDFEDEAPDDGKDPTALLRVSSITIPNPISKGSPLEKVDYSSLPTGWRKVDNVASFLQVRNAPFPQLHLVTGDHLPKTDEQRLALIEDITASTGERTVVRTECTAGSVRALNMPRTDTKFPADAVDFMIETRDKFKNMGVCAHELCFILHQFIPAISSAWAFADPDEQIVFIDALWGVPDGLQYLPHDSFQYDVIRGKETAERTRYKPLFIQEVADGSWQQIPVLRRLARHRCLSQADVEEVGKQTHELSLALNRPVQVMWFCDIPAAAGIGRNVPWFMQKAENSHPSVSPSPGPRLLPFSIKNPQDLDDLLDKNISRVRMVLEPETSFIRENEGFLDRVISVAKTRNLPVELHGSTLGHAYYYLARAGVTVIVSDAALRQRVRGKQEFRKLVRDSIPSQIKKSGERVKLAKISKHESRTALIVKLFEEAMELRDAKSPEEVKYELADIVEVVRSLCQSTGTPWGEVLEAADAKRAKRGSFTEGVVLLETSWPKPDSSDDHELGTKISLEQLAACTFEGDRLRIPFTRLLLGTRGQKVSLKSGTDLLVLLDRDGLAVEELQPRQLSLPL